MSDDGHNPMRWKCTEIVEEKLAWKDGCFNRLCRPKIETFAGCFPRDCNFGDVDGIIEIGGYFALLEWKSKDCFLKTGQRLTYLRFTKRLGNIVFFVLGDPETMKVEQSSIFWAGQHQKLEVGDLHHLKARIKRWADLADTQDWE